MQIDGKIGFVGGGRMAEALIKGMCKAEIITPEKILVSEPDQGRRDYLESIGVATYDNQDKLIKECSIIILAVKPQVIGQVLAGLKGQVDEKHMLISIAAGISLSFIQNALGDNACKLIRVMPNTPALVQEGASALSPGVGVSEKHLAIAKMIFDAVGKSVILSENYMDAVTGLSGSGPAYVLSFIEAMTDAGVKVGMTRDNAQLLTCQTILGTVKMAMESQEHPAQLRAMVTSPGGTTIAGLHVMERAGFSGIVMDAVEAATRRSKELGGE